MKKLIKLSYRYNHPVKKYLKSKRYFICTGSTMVSKRELNKILKLFK